jgi:hypothetical protein
VKGVFFSIKISLVGSNFHKFCYLILIVAGEVWYTTLFFPAVFHSFYPMQSTSGFQSKIACQIHLCNISKETDHVFIGGGSYLSLRQAITSLALK